MKFFFSCDWGTSAFRLRLVNTEELTILSEIKTSYGVAAAFELWKQEKRNEKDRIAFYQAYLFEQVKKVITTADNLYHNAPIILSGMASSSIGMMELPYKQLPFECNGASLVIDIIHEQNHHRKIAIISGARSATEVIRGEETMLAGCNVLSNDMQQLFIFPGTHSKHILVKNGMAQSIATYMTGELFDLLSKKSILSQSVKKSEEGDTSTRHFMEGVNKGMSSNLLNSIFSVRTNQLFGKTTLTENYDYLSGLLIGHELKEIGRNKYNKITLVCGPERKKAYMEALDVPGLSAHVEYKNADDALIRGQCEIMKQHNFTG